MIKQHHLKSGTFATSLLLATTLFSSLSGCATDASGSEATEQLEDQRNLNPIFLYANKNQEPVASDALRVGDLVQVVYDRGRASCADPETVLHYRTNGSTITTVKLEPAEAGDFARKDISFGTAGDLEIWFENFGTGCGGWDSNHGANFRFEVLPAPTTLTFSNSWQETVDGVVMANREVRVDYDLNRIGCHLERNGMPAWGVGGYYRINGGETKRFAIESARLPEGSSMGQGHFTPEEEGEIEIWFRSSNYGGCVAYDSNDGENYSFDIAAYEAAPANTIAFNGNGESVAGLLQKNQAITLSYDTSRIGCREWYRVGWAYSVKAFYRVNGGAIQETTLRFTNSDARSASGSIQVGQSGELEIWFQSSGYSGCRDYDSNDGDNHSFEVQ